MSDSLPAETQVRPKRQYKIEFDVEERRAAKMLVWLKTRYPNIRVTVEKAPRRREGGER